MEEGVLAVRTAGDGEVEPDRGDGELLEVRHIRLGDDGADPELGVEEAAGGDGEPFNPGGGGYRLHHRVPRSHGGGPGGKLLVRRRTGESGLSRHTLIIQVFFLLLGD